MNFFKSILAADPDDSDHSPTDHEEEDDRDQEEAAESPNPNPNPNSQSAWSFGGLIKTIASKSESVIETYRRDLEEFGTELKKETSVFKEVAARAVLDLPGSLEVGASVAQESLESVGQVIDDFGGSVWRGTAEIISHGKDALFTVDSDMNSQNLVDPQHFNGSSSKRYSRFELQVLAIQNDEKTFVEEVEDSEDFGKWNSKFRLEEKEEEIEGILYDNGTLEGFYEKLVPDVVDQETFWSRYFYRVQKLKQAEDARAKLVKRAISSEEEEELSWEVDDDDGNEEEAKGEIQEAEKQKKEGEMAKEETKPIKEAVVEEEKEIVGTIRTRGEEEEEVKKEIGEEEEVKKEIIDTPTSIERPECENVEMVEKDESSDDADLTSKVEDKTPLEPKSEPVESCKDSDFSVISTQPSVHEEEDLEWDEIEDLGEHEDRKAGGSSANPKPVDLRKRLIVAEDDEDLSWDIEDDDDEPAKP